MTCMARRDRRGQAVHTPGGGRKEVDGSPCQETNSFFRVSCRKLWIFVSTWKKASQMKEEDEEDADKSQLKESG